MADTAGFRRSSRLARRSSKTGTPYLPLEVKGIVAKFLCKWNLKNLRCVSKQWHAMATPLLFDQVYVSPLKKDIQTFSHITNHPVLSRSIKRIIGDVSTMPDFSHEVYFHHLCEKWRDMTISLGEKDPFTSLYPRLNEFVNAIIGAPRSRESLFSKYANDEHIIEGFQRWQDLAKEEREALGHEDDGIRSSKIQENNVLLKSSFWVISPPKPTIRHNQKQHIEQSWHGHE